MLSHANIKKTPNYVIISKHEEDTGEFTVIFYLDSERKPSNSASLSDL